MALHGHGDPGPAAPSAHVSIKSDRGCTSQTSRARVPSVRLRETSPHPDQGSQALGAPGDPARDRARGPTCM